ERIADIARSFRIPVLTDEVYRQFLYDGEFVSIMSLPGMREHSILLDGFAKSFAMTGWRLGDGVMGVPLAEHLTRLMVNSAWRPSSRGSRPDGAAVVPNVADLLIQELIRAGTRRLFVAPDDGSTPMLLQSAEAQGLPVTHAHSEFAACVMAAVSGELTGAPG